MVILFALDLCLLH